MYNSIEDNNDFLNEYERVVQPRRWQRIYKNILPNYSNNTEELIFTNKPHQKSIFSNKEKMAKPMQVLVCTEQKKQAQEKLIREIKEKITLAFI